MAAKTKTPKARAPRALRQAFGPFKGMRTAVEERASDPSLVQYALNMVPLDPVAGAAYVVRPAALDTSGLPNAVVDCYHVLTTNAAIIPFAVVQGEIWTLQSGTSWGRVVSATDMVAAGIAYNPYSFGTVTRLIYAITFAGKAVISDGLNPPFTWDGTAGSAGLTQLANCPALFGPPTEYAGKLMGIKAADPRTIVWSEENDPATGYEAGGFNNAWTIGQQADEPLTRLLGRNDGLYYWRRHGFGVIVGAVAGDFRTTHTHDALSSSIGCAAPATVVDTGDALWWYSTNERVYCYAIGGELRDVSPEITATHSEQVSAPDRFKWLRRGSLTSTRFELSSGALIGPNDFLDRRQVWLSLPGYNGSPASCNIVLAYDVATRRPLSWFTQPLTGGGGSGFWRLTALQSPDGQHGVFAAFQLADGGAHLITSVTRFLCYLTAGSDGLEAGTAVTGVLVGPAAAHDDGLELSWDRCDVALRFADQAATIDGARGTLTFSASTSAEQVDAVPALAAAAVPPPGHVGFVTTGKLSYGYDVVGRWLRPRFECVWQYATIPVAPGAFGDRPGFGIQGYTLTAVAASEDPDAP